MTRPPLLRASYDLLPGELVVDNFAGGGGASTGIEAAIGRPVDFAINHSPEAIAVHKANHPETRHFCENILEVDPVVACGGRPVGLAWFSPDCTHFSRAKGTQPVKKEIRGLAWVVVRWARTVRPRVIVLENVEEFQTWGPLNDDGRPDPARAGETFREWLAELAACGYSIEFRSLVAADYGSPTTRRRLFLVARRDGGGIAWPEPSHGAGRPASWRSAAEVIDWSLPCPSIFERSRPLAEATLRRIAAGIRRYVIDAAEPFILPLTHGRRGDGSFDSRVHSIGEPVRTITGANRGELAFCSPFLAKYHGGQEWRGQPPGEPLRTIDTANRFALCSPFIVRHGHYSTRTGAGLHYIKGGPGTFRGQQLSLPLSTVCATDDRHLVAPIITKHYGRQIGHRVDSRPLGTITARDHHALTAAFLVKYYGAAAGQSQGLREPLHTVTSRARFGLVTIHGEEYQIVDIGMRMLQPHELFAAQGFPDDYQIAPTFNGRPLTKTAQIALAGNSVCPQVAAAVVGDQVGSRRAA